MRYCLTLVRMAIIKKSTNNKCWRGCGEKRNPPTLDEVGEVIMENTTEVPYKTKNRVTIWSSNPIPGNILGNNSNSKRYVHREFIVVIFMLAKTWKKPKCPSTDEWIKMMWYVYTMEYSLAIKENEIMPFAVIWMNLEIIILSQVRQRQIPYITLMWNLKKWYKWAFLKKET